MKACIGPPMRAFTKKTVKLRYFDEFSIFSSNFYFKDFLNNLAVILASDLNWFDQFRRIYRQIMFKILCFLVYFNTTLSFTLALFTSRHTFYIDIKPWNVTPHRRCKSLRSSTYTIFPLPSVIIMFWTLFRQNRTM